MSNIDWIVLVSMLLFVALTAVFFIYKLAAGRGVRRRGCQNQQKNIVVQNGVDVKKQMLGSGKGQYFSGNLKEYDTNLIKGAWYPVWWASFQDMDSGKIYQCRFIRQMVIGRVPASQKSEVCLVLEGDAKVSKLHCIIYEEEKILHLTKQNVYGQDGRLMLEDKNSKNHTYVNGHRADGPVVLQTGDVIKTGDTRLKIEFGKKG